ncbi:hypothetical protein ES703_46478 [subsurface metagenome]
MLFGGPLEENCKQNRTKETGLNMMRHPEGTKEGIMKRFIIGILLLALVSLAGCGSAPAVPGEEEEEPVGEEEEEPIIEEPEIATFTISDLSISPTELDIGERITISAVATNNGDLAGDYNMVFKINNVAVETVNLTIDGGVSQRVDFAATVDYAAETYSVNVNGLLGTFTVKEPPPSAEFTITGFDQTYYEALGKWSDYVYVNYKIQNNGEVHISYYEVYFTITCDDGSQYQEWTNGSHIFVGQEWPSWTIAEVEGKKVTSVELTDLELRAGGVAEVIYEITGTADRVDVTLNNASGGTEQYDDVRLPQRYAYSSFTDWFLYISAQNQGEYGTVRVAIYLNGKVVETASSSGAYVIATASGSK